MKTITIRKLPDNVSDWLAEEAGKRHMSVNSMVVSLLKESAFPDANKKGKKRDLSSFSGAWSAAEAKEFNRAVESECEKVYPDEWQSKGGR